MPILSPSLQFALSSLSEGPDSLNAIRFYLRYLRIASRNICRNYRMVTASKKFKKDLLINITCLNEKYNWNLIKDDFLNSQIIDFYEYLYNKITLGMIQDDKTPKTLCGWYFKIIDNNIETSYFSPNLFQIGIRTWLFTDSGIAILSFNGYITTNDYPLILLETDLMVAAGFTLVLCANYFNCQPDQLFEMIGRNQFSEIHINFFNRANPLFFFIEKSGNHSHFQRNMGFVYLYTSNIENIETPQNVKTHQKLEKLKKITRLSVFMFSNLPPFTVSSDSIVKIKPFRYCKNGFLREPLPLRVFLSNVPLYTNDKSKTVPLETSGQAVGYISPDDFLNWKNDLIEISLVDKDTNKCVTRYVKFEDIHKTNPNLYIEDQLTIAEIDEETIQKINDMIQNIRTIIEKNKGIYFLREAFWTMWEKSFQKVLEKIVCLYTRSKGDNFFIYKTQLYTAFEACKNLLNKKNKQMIGYQNQLKMINSFQSFLSLIEQNDNQQLTTVTDENSRIEKDKLINWSNKNMQALIQNFLDVSSKNFDKMISNDYWKIYLTKLSKSDKRTFNEILNQKKKEIEGILNKNIDDHKGIVFQVETGEGKTCIIAVIAAILALSGKIVHIASSNIKLANKDYMDSFQFFNKLKMRSGVFLHEDELPFTRPKHSESNPIWAVNYDEIYAKDEMNHKSNVQKDNNEKVDINSPDYLYNEYKKEYYENFVQNEANNFRKYYLNGLYDPEVFNNSSGMNFEVCGVNLDNKTTDKPPSVIFSTLVNFECFYLKMMEICPGYIESYYGNCVLLVDEADSILIDEIQNGTIISREVKSNAKEILKYIYDKKQECNWTAAETWFKIKDDPKFAGLQLKDIEKMHEEIDLVTNDPEYENGKKYFIQTKEVKNDKKKKKYINQALNLGKRILTRVGKGLIKLITSENKDGEEDDDDDDDDDEDEEEPDDPEEEDEADDPVIVFKEIVPYDYDHKGISEPSKEFSGFIQQFIAIKESKKPENKNMIVKDISISYLYISHPIFVKLYSKVCGFTGTIGTKEDRKIIKDNYDLMPIEIPRNKANYRVELPLILCKNVEERAYKISYEVILFHKQGNPVIVIFQDLKEIKRIWEILSELGIRGINIIDGTNPVVRPDKISGKYGAITLGTNVCGRGTDIEVNEKPLHVIIAYYTSNKRVMDQARGRTARKGREGTCRVICLEKQYFHSVSIDSNGTNAVLGEFEVKKQMQSKFIQYYMYSADWIFSRTFNKLDFNDDDIIYMRSARINVNRIVAYNYRFPLKMNVDTFLEIQAQKIFSLLNCPNGEFTWKLFQRYAREMIFQSWSITLNQFDEDFFSKESNLKYKNDRNDLLKMKSRISNEQYQKLVEAFNLKYSNTITEYRSKLSNKLSDLVQKIGFYINPNYNIHGVFITIMKIVVDKYQEKILSTFSNIPNCFYQKNTCGFLSFQVGFKPYSLLTESGARITHKNFHKMNYIKDPELKYLKKTPKGKITWMSITEKIDDLFNWIFQEINKILGKKTSLKFFLRRTLFGCEFGICLDIPFEAEDIEDKYCLVDKDPLLIFTISVKSIIPVLAGILIIVLGYVASISSQISQWIVAFPAKLTKEFAQKAVSIIINSAAKELVKFALQKAIDFLSDILKKQLDELKSIEEENDKYEEGENNKISKADMIKMILHFVDSKIGEKAQEKLGDFVKDKIKVATKFGELLKNSVDMQQVIKIGLLIILCISTFVIKNFSKHDEAIEYAKENAEAFENDDREQVERVKEEIKEETVIVDRNENSGKKNEVQEFLEDDTKINKFLLSACNPFEFVKRMINYADNKLEEYEEISNGIAVIKRVAKKNNSLKQVQRMRYYGIQKFFTQQLQIYVTNKLPSILEVVGCHIGRGKQDIYFKKKHRWTLESYLQDTNNKKLSKTSKLIIAYGVACAMELLHSHNIVHRNLKPSVILLDRAFRPYVSEFYYARQTDGKYKYALTEIAAEFAPPEFIRDCMSNQNSFKIDIYAFGITLLWLFNKKNPFGYSSPGKIMENTLKGIHPEIPSKISPAWKDLINRCLNQDPKSRPSFKQIRKYLESDVFVNDSIKIPAFSKYKKLFEDQK